MESDFMRGFLVGVVATAFVMGGWMLPPVVVILFRKYKKYRRW